MLCILHPIVKTYRHAIWLWLVILLGLVPGRGMTTSAPHGTNSAPHYSYRETIVFEDLDSDGKVKETSTEVKEVFPVDGYMFARVVSRDGKPLSAEEAKEEAQRLEKFRATIRQGKVPKQDGISFDSVSGEFADVKDGAAQEGMSLEKVGKESILERSCILYTFSGRKKAGTNQPAATPPKAESQPSESGTKERREFGRELMKSIGGRIWMDEEEQSPARLDVKLERPMHVAWCMISIKRLDFHADFRRLEPKLWTLETATALVNIRAFLLVNHTFRVTMTRDNFKDTKEPR